MGGPGNKQARHSAGHGAQLSHLLDLQVYPSWKAPTDVCSPVSPHRGRELGAETGESITPACPPFSVPRRHGRQYGQQAPCRLKVLLSRGAPWLVLAPWVAHENSLHTRLGGSSPPVADFARPPEAAALPLSLKTSPATQTRLPRSYTEEEGSALSPAGLPPDRGRHSPSSTWGGLCFSALQPP